jgi:hypothetical protein
MPTKRKEPSPGPESQADDDDYYAGAAEVVGNTCLADSSRGPGTATRIEDEATMRVIAAAQKLAAGTRRRIDEKAVELRFLAQAGIDYAIHRSRMRAEADASLDLVDILSRCDGDRMRAGDDMAAQLEVTIVEMAAAQVLDDLHRERMANGDNGESTVEFDTYGEEIVRG